MNIIIAPDSFKESLSAYEVALAIESGVKTVWPQANTHCIPMADGGEGTVDAILNGVKNAQAMQCDTVNALGQAIQATWVLLPDQTAVIEMACAAGIEQIPPEQRDIMQANTYGVGLVVKAALNQANKPIKRLILGLGGSVTNDGGIGMLAALGVRFLDKNQQELQAIPANMTQMTHIDCSQLDPQLNNIQIDVASDVSNPLCGPQGASAIFGPQKGATPHDVQVLDQALAHLAKLSQQVLGYDLSQEQGAGAAGGLGFAALAYLNAKFSSGLQLIAHLAQLEQAIATANLVFTGEGRIDSQSLKGKTPVGVAGIAQKHHVPVIVIAGSIGDLSHEIYDMGISAVFSLCNGPISLDEAKKNARNLIKQQVSNIVRTMQLGSN